MDPSTQERTRGSVLLDEIMTARGLGPSAVGAATGYPHSIVIEWRRGTKRPEAHARRALCLWSNGDIPEDSWMRPEEVDKLGKVTPLLHADHAGYSGDSAQPGTDAQDTNVDDTGEHPVCSCGQKGAA